MATNGNDALKEPAEYADLLPGERLNNHVLVLDDNTDILTTVRRIAVRAGYAVTTVDRTDSFVEKFKAEKPSMVILDIVLGSQDVMSVIDFLGKEQFAAPVVLMSGYDHRMLRAVAEVARDRGLRIAGSVEKGAGLERLAPLLEAHHLGGRQL